MQNEDCRGKAQAKPDSQLPLSSPSNCASASPKPDFHNVYILKSLSAPDTFYTGLTSDLKARLAKHNRGDVKHTCKAKPWQVKNAIAFTNREEAAAFEKYLKSHSGRAFAKRHF